ncbi:MAG: GAF domain-containing protein, partial [Chloroflexota bacterium]|nr:GAF domain-containing protein [Chloroflexota bacterium]
LWAEVDAALEQEIRPVNKRMNLLVRRLVRQTDRDVEAVALHVQMVVWRAVLLLVILTVFTTVIALGWRQIVFRGLGRSITELRQGVARISGGDLAYKLDVRTGDEVEELGDEFNRMAGELADVIGDLERRVVERTRGLQAAAEVGRATTSVLDPDQLLRRVVNLARERFGLYYVGLFLIESDSAGRTSGDSGRTSGDSGRTSGDSGRTSGDSGRTFGVLRAGTGEAGRQMMAQGHRLQVGGDSMIGQCTASAEARVALDVGEEAVRFDNPLLPLTRSELALPLVARGRVIGAMTVQSLEEAAFDQEYIAALQTMADQVAVAINNAWLFTEAQTALDEMTAIQQRYLGQAWAEYAQTAEETAYETGRAGVVPLSDAVLSEIQQAVEHGRVAVLPSALHASSPHSALVAPIALRGEIIGALGVHGDEKSRRWSDDDIAIVEAVAERMALAADNLRLLEDTQRRAARERLTSEVAGQVRASLDPDTILKTTVRELSRALGAELASIEITGSLGNDTE